jgi:type I restriction enzyme M protein
VERPRRKSSGGFYAELVYRYGYQPERVGVEVTVPDRTPADRADLVIFEDDKHTKPFAVIECKRDDISDTEFKQAIEQAFGNGQAHKFRAKYIGVVAGLTRAFYDCSDKYGALEREENIIADLPEKYGEPEEFKYYYKAKGKPDIAPISRDELIKIIQKSHQTLWGGGRLSPPTAFGELTKLIFLKTRDEKIARKKGEPYQFQIKTKEKPDKLSGRIKKLYAEERDKEPDVFTDDIKIDDLMLKNVVQHLESVNLSETDLDTKGVAFEQFMDSFFKGNFGQYFTPRNIIAFAIKMLNLKVEDTVIDPACGSGGFLLHALDHIRKAAGEYYDEGGKEHFDYWHSFAEKRLFGIEINDEIARVAKMNMIVHDDGHTNIIGHDALEPLEKVAKKNPAFGKIIGINENGHRDESKGFSVIATNPPFGAVINNELNSYLEGYELSRYSGDEEEPGKRSKKPRSSVKTEIIYCERIWQLLKPGGKAAVVLPDGLLTNDSLQYVRDWILERFKLLAVVSLPQFAFAHYGAGVKSSVLFLEKRKRNERADDAEAVFMAMAENVGYDATGRMTYRVEVRTEKPNRERTVWETCDLLTWEVVYDWVGGDGKKPGHWTERHREIVPGTGLLGQYEKFQKNPKPFFV